VFDKGRAGALRWRNLFEVESVRISDEAFLSPSQTPPYIAAPGRPRLSVRAAAGAATLIPKRKFERLGGAGSLLEEASSSRSFVFGRMLLIKVVKREKVCEQWTKNISLRR
jgi:hypothetical protein